VALDRSFNQHHADIYVMLKMQQRLIAAPQEAVFYGISNDWIDRANMLIVDAEFCTDFMKIKEE